jgi:hypothetical protein
MTNISVAMTPKRHFIDQGGNAAKFAGQQLTLDVNTEWKHAVMVELRAWLERQKAAGTTHMTMEAFRAVARNQPSSHKAWGAMTTAAKHAGLIEFDGYVRAQSVKTHAHPIGHWRIV